MEHRPGLLRSAVACMATASVVAISLFASPDRADGQIDRLRRARERVTATPSLKALFGDEPAITTTTADAKDGVPALDGFEPDAFSPMGEMPQGPGGYFLLAPGAYTFEAQSFCLRAGTYGPTLRGGGYLHAELQGPKAELISAIIGRSADHMDIPQKSVQALLWAVLARAKPSAMPPEMKLTAARLLTTAELAEQEGYALDAVPDAIRKRALANVPAAAQSVFEAENEMRRLFSSSTTRFEDLERVAVLSGALPPGEEGDALPRGRWSFHPNGYFIRYQPGHYTQTRIQVYYPVSVEIERDAKGRIVSVKTPDGSWVEADYGDAPAVSFARTGVERRESELRVIRFARRPGGPASFSSEWHAEPGVRIPAPRWPEGLRAGGLGAPSPLDLPRADLEDLAVLGAMVEQVVGSRAGTDAADAEALVRGAVHTALARYYHVQRVGTDAAEATNGPALRLAWGEMRTRYAIAAGGDAGSRFQHPGRMMPLQPGSGGAFPGGPIMQRLGQSARPPDEDILDKARRYVDRLSKASDGLGLGTDPAGFFGGAIPGQLFGAGMDWNFDNARTISDAMQGATGGTDDSAMLGPSPHGPELTPDPLRRIGGQPLARWASLSLTPRWEDPDPLAPRVPQDYRTIARPRNIELPKTPASEISPEHAAAVDAVLERTFRLGALMEATVTAQERFRQAAMAHDAEWENAQGEALVFLKREAGLAMEGLAGDLEALGAVAGAAHGVDMSEAKAREAQVRLEAEGIPQEAVDVARAVGLPDSWARTRQARLTRLSPADIADDAAPVLQALIDELRSYGAYWGSLPVVPQPWPGEGAPGQG